MSGRLPTNRHGNRQLTQAHCRYLLRIISAPNRQPPVDTFGPQHGQGRDTAHASPHDLFAKAQW